MGIGKIDFARAEIDGFILKYSIVVCSRTEFRKDQLNVHALFFFFRRDAVRCVSR